MLDSQIGLSLILCVLTKLTGCGLDLGSSLYPISWASYGYSHVGDNVMLVTYGWRQF